MSVTAGALGSKYEEDGPFNDNASGKYVSGINLRLFGSFKYFREGLVVALSPSLLGELYDPVPPPPTRKAQYSTSNSFPTLTSSPSYPLQLLITQLYSLLGLIPEPSRFADIKSSFLRYRYKGIKVSSTFEFLLKPRIVFEFCKQGGKLLF